MSSVGVIPYFTGATTLDRLGLTDREVAHSGFTNDLMAHGKRATIEYARRRGVDLWFYDPVYAHESLLSRRMMLAAVETKQGLDDVWAAEVSRDTFLLCVLPQGAAAAVRRMPRLRFRSLGDSTFSHEYFARAIEQQRGIVGKSPSDLEARGKLAMLCLSDDRYAEAEQLYREIVRQVPDDAETLDHLAACELGLGWYDRAAGTVERELDLLRRAGRTPRTDALERDLATIRAQLAKRTAASD